MQRLWGSFEIFRDTDVASVLRWKKPGWQKEQMNKSQWMEPSDSTREQCDALLHPLSKQFNHTSDQRCQQHVGMDPVSSHSTQTWQEEEMEK